MKQLLPILISFLASGCSLATINPGPDRLYSIAEETAQIRQFNTSIDRIPNPYSKEFRNNFITSRMYAIDVAYSKYFADLTKEREFGRLGTDTVLLGLGAATSVVGGAGTKAILGAATTAVAGTGDAIDKDIFIEQTIQVLLNQMQVDRLTIRNRMEETLKKTDIDQYTIYQGLSDLESYYRAGTLASALASLSATVGNNAQQHKDLQEGTKPNAESTNGSLDSSQTPSGVRVQGFAPAGTR